MCLHEVSSGILLSGDLNTFLQQVLFVALLSLIYAK